MALGVLVAVLFAGVASSGPVRYVDGPPRFDPRPIPANQQQVPTDVVTTIAAETAPHDGDGLQVPGFVRALLNATASLVVIVAAMIALRWLWHNRPRLHWRRRQAAPFEPLSDIDDVTRALGADADATRTVLLTGSPRNAIVECWMRLEHTVELAGVRRDLAETATELTQRVLLQTTVDPLALAQLADLYREARFSDHTIDESMRQDAVSALDAVHAALTTSVR